MTILKQVNYKENMEMKISMNEWRNLQMKIYLLWFL